jgi:hypothetical protein
MTALFNSGISLASLVFICLALPGCNSQPPAESPDEGSGLKAAEPNQTRPVPRRTNPIVVTNAFLIEEPQHEETNHPPVIACGGPQVIPCSPPEGALVAVTVRVFDQDSDPITVTWAVDDQELHIDQLPSEQTGSPIDLVWTHTFVPGDYTVKVTASDGNLHASCTIAVSVQVDVTDPVIACPDNITVYPDPGFCTALVNYTAIASDDCPDVTVTYEPPSGSAFPIGITTVTCTAVDAAGNTAECQFDVIVQTGNRCPRGERYWQQNANAWPIASIRLGNHSYTRTDAMRLLRNASTSDASIVLARQLIATTLNTALRSDPTPICGELTQAHALLAAHTGRLPLRINTTTAAGESMISISRVLSSYNSGMLSPNCVP